MARTHAEILAAVKAADTKVAGMRETLVGLSEGMVDLKAEIQKLKDNGTVKPEDLTDLDEAATSLEATVEGAAKAIDAGTIATSEGSVSG